jgi:group I intron endonuclease
VEVYVHFNTITSLSYIGWTKNTAEKRFRQHCQDARNNRYPDCYFHRALRKYGPEVFETFKVQVDTAEEAKRGEIAIIARFDPDKLYNMTRGGDGFTGRHTEEAKRKVGLASKGNKYAAGNTPWNKGKKMDAAYRERCRRGMKGKAHTDETRCKMSEKRKAYVAAHPESYQALVQSTVETRFQKGLTPWNKGVPLSEETRAKLSNALRGRSVWNKGKPHSEKHRAALRTAWVLRKQRGLTNV